MWNDVSCNAESCENSLVAGGVVPVVLQFLASPSDSVRIRAAKVVHNLSIGACAFARVAVSSTVTCEPLRSGVHGSSRRMRGYFDACARLFKPA